MLRNSFPAFPVVVALGISLSACKSGQQVGDMYDDSGTAGTEESGEGEGETDDGGTDDEGETDDDGGTDDDGTDSGMPKLDVGDDTEDPEIPETCVAAEVATMTVGCEFYAVDLPDLSLNQGWSVAVSNVQSEQAANVTIEEKMDGQWAEFDAATIPALDLVTFEPKNTGLAATTLVAGHAYRVRSDVPVSVYQINPKVGGSNSGDASLLYPHHTWDHVNEVVGWDNGTSPGMVYFSVVAGHDGTEVVVDTATDLAAGPMIPALPAGQQYMVELDEGDMLTMFAQNADESVTGVRVGSPEDKPVAVFSGARCIYVPSGNGACDHLETQLSGLQLWGETFVASRMPVRVPEDPEDTPWHIYASKDGTTVQFSANGNVTGLPDEPVMLDAGELLELWVTGDPADPGDFLVEADEPIAVLNYMKGSYALPVELDFPGDPAMIQIAPVEQFLPIYVVLVPEGWENDFLVLTRRAGEAVELDDVLVPDDAFVEVPGGFEVARVEVEDGVHRLVGDGEFAVEVIGYESTDSYAYLGGAKTELINPEG